MIGTRSIILPDVKIGNNVVIAAGSIITKDIPDNCVADGVPAKVIGNFDDLVEKRRNLKLSASDSPELLWNNYSRKESQNKIRDNENFGYQYCPYRTEWYH